MSDLSGASFIRALISFVRLHPYDLSTIKSPTFIVPSSLGFGFQHMDFEEAQNVFIGLVIPDRIIANWGRKYPQMAQRSILSETTVLPSVWTRSGLLDDRNCKEVGVWEKEDDPQTQ